MDMETFVRERDYEHLRGLGIFYLLSCAATLFNFCMMAVIASQSSSWSLPSIPWGSHPLEIYSSSVFLLKIALLFLNFLCACWISSGRHRLFCQFVATLNLPLFAYGTVLGVATLLVLNRASVQKLSGLPERIEPNRKPDLLD